MKISVCMATYNGGEYIKNQLDSILSQLKQEDELIISDDGSIDNTIEIISQYDNRKIRLVVNTNSRKGPPGNFENAIRESRGEIIVFCDQDDIWMPNKLEVIRLNFHDKIGLKYLLMCDGYCIDKNGVMLDSTIYNLVNVKTGLLRNLVKNSFIGCNMAITKELLEIALPFPEDIAMHDWWLGLVANMYGKVIYDDRKVMKYRLHEFNVSRQRQTITTQVKWRVTMLVNLLKLKLNYHIK